MRAMRPCYGGCEHYHYDWKDFEGYDGGYDEDYGYDDIYWELRGPCEWCGLWLRYWPDFVRTSPFPPVFTISS